MGNILKSTKLIVGLFAVGLSLLIAPVVQAQVTRVETLPDGAQRISYRIGPLSVTPGQNRIDNKTITGLERPAANGWITRIQPDLVRADGSVPKSSQIMFHHGVWINNSYNDTTGGSGERFYATGEEKTIVDLPDGFGYRYKKTDNWVFNNMIHNLTPEAMTLYAAYTVNFIPDTAPTAAGIRPVRPIWMDVENGSGYPVFDTHRDSGGADGEFTYPQDTPGGPYGGGRKKNEWTVDRDGVLINTTGHVHTGGLNTELFMRRAGASYKGALCDQPLSRDSQMKLITDRMAATNTKIEKHRQSMKPKKIKRLRKNLKPKKFRKVMKQKRKWGKKLKGTKQANLAEQRELQQTIDSEQATYQGCLDVTPTVEGNRVRLFRSKAEYFEPAGPVSWDMAMRTTSDNWKVAVKRGDTLELQTTYETKLASWYENMGIDIIYMADDQGDGRNPYDVKVDTAGVLNHGHYSENEDHGGTAPVVGPDPAKLADGRISGGPFQIGGYSYEAGDFRLPGAAGYPPVVQKGQSFTFKLSAADQATQTWHSLTSCKSPCNKSTGIAYPIADGDFQFDSGQLGKGGAPTVNRDSWSTPADLPVGTHTFYCRIHPLMRGAVRVVPAGT